MKLESVLEAELIVRVRAAGGVAEKVTVLGARGYFDRLVVLPPGRVVFCELKRGKLGRLSAHQVNWQNKYRDLGAQVAIIRSSADIDRLLANPNSV
jgi:hypothetical protein